MPSRTRLAAALLALSTLSAVPAAAQASALASAAGTAPSAAREEAPFTPRATFSVNPLGMVVGFHSLEGEARLSRSVTAGASVSQFGLGWETTISDDAGTREEEGRVRYRSGEGKVRWYPGGDAPRGFSVAGTGGYTDLRGDLFAGDGAGRASRGHAWTAGTSLDYNWFTGSDGRVLVGAGLGMKRSLAADVRDENDTAVHGVLPTLRLTVGYAF